MNNTAKNNFNTSILSLAILVEAYTLTVNMLSNNMKIADRQNILDFI